MMEILATGPLCSVQDIGRRGYRSLGVSIAGAMDQVALRTGNILVGNDETAAGIEVTVFPFKARFTENARVAVTGADCRATIGEKALLPWWSFDISEGDVLTLSPPCSGARAYIAVSGGIDVPVVLNSRSTDIKVGFGGFEGRCLRRGDVLSFVGSRCGSGSFGVFPPEESLDHSFGVSREPGVTYVRAMSGPEYEEFPETTRRFVWDTSWTVTPDSNRIGYRLEGPELRPSAPLSLLSHGIVPGVVQIPPSGKPIVMMSDAQTSGGYPKIATVIEADLWRLAQSPLGSRVRFVEVDIEECVAASRELTKHLSSIARSSWRGPWK
ncbi:biotin-dependent carboxyltransferase family protein [Burkholderia stagnalis]|uniref:5-oxoprolinase subunit C family protein n=1 Tax=Burkholderia stagnalis TaxID=1503054 RepID=UPI0009C1414F|nr:biotin-dependent carboxyltransferase family protein [Burkholderia stagnalis]